MLDVLLTTEDINWVEALNTGLLDPVFMTQGVTMKTEHLVPNLTGRLKDGGYTKLDLLGFGIWSTPGSGVFYGVLD